MCLLRRLPGWLPALPRSGRVAVWICHVRCSSHRSSRCLRSRVSCRRAREGRDGTTGGTITHGDGSPVPSRAPASPAHLDGAPRLAVLSQVPVELGALPSGHAHEFADFRSPQQGPRRVRAIARLSSVSAPSQVPASSDRRPRYSRMALLVGERNRPRAATPHPVRVGNGSSARRYRRRPGWSAGSRVRAWAGLVAGGRDEEFTGRVESVGIPACPAAFPVPGPG